jgi:hypothetical protein
LWPGGFLPLPVAADLLGGFERPVSDEHRQPA